MSTIGGWLSTSHPTLFFEDTLVGQLKRDVWEAPEEVIDAILAEYGIPAPSELGKPRTYIQNTVRHDLIENRRKNDIAFIPVGSTECHGDHTVSGFDTLLVTQILEAVRRFTAKGGRPVNLAWPPVNYGAHPYHHVGMPGTVMLEEEVLKRTLMNVILGLWNDGFRKQIILNNHGQLWVLEAAIQEFQKAYQLPGIFRVIDWHRAVREFFRTEDRGGPFVTDFVHADEAETSLGLLLLHDMVTMKWAVDSRPLAFLPDGHADKAVVPFARPCKWSEGQGHFAIEMAATPEGVVGKPTLAQADKARRPIAAILKYLTLLVDQILAAFPPGSVPPVEKITLRTAAEMEPYLREPGSPGWKSVYALPKLGM